MDILFLIFALLAVVVLSRIIANLIPVPLPIIQILLGVALASPPIAFEVELDPEIFMLLFIPPLLFYDGWKIPKKEFTEHGWRIGAFSVLLVLFAVVAIGYLIHWLLPSLPFMMCFALAAILSPTDALAVIAITNGKLPKHMMHQLEGEAMMNDATGLVSFKFAVAAAVTGAFSFYSATGSFLLVACGGLLIGAALSWLVGQMHRMMRSFGLLDPATYVLVVLMLPFGAFYVAELAGMSGILAAVAAGMIQSRVEMLPQKTNTRIIHRSLWEMLDHSFNGIVFVLLGLQFPLMIKHLLNSEVTQSVSLGELSWYAVIIMAALVAFRFVFVLAYDKISEVVAAAYEKRTPVYRVTTREVMLAALTTVSGVRGAITLAGVLSLPMVFAGEPFDDRNLMIFIAGAVIVMSILIGAVGLPLLLRHFDSSSYDNLEKELAEARKELANFAISWINDWSAANKEHRSEEGRRWVSEVSARMKHQYKEDLDALAGQADSGELNLANEIYRIELSARRQIIQSKRYHLYLMLKSHRIDDQVMQVLLKDLDYEDASLEALSAD